MGKNRLGWLLLSLLVILVYGTEPTYCFEVDTHRMLNTIAIKQVIDEGGGWGFRLDQYLNYPLGFKISDASWGRNSDITWRMVQEWIKEGGATEDDSPRYVNHFHDPLKPWDQAGIRILGYPFFSSSVVWAQMEKGEQEYSWHDARAYYYQALSGTTPAQRLGPFQKTFRALGQIMHLVEDAAVPDHTRNDYWHGPKAYFLNANTFERWTDGNLEDFISLSVPDFTKEQADQILGQKGDNQAPVPISRVFDMNLYLLGARPNITRDTLAGIAEYSNSNFLSAVTVFKDYTFPSPESTEPLPETTYLQKVRDGEVIDHFVRARSYGPWARYILDPTCYRDYATLLLPKAAAYASLIPYYFFRASLNVHLQHNPGSALYYNVLRVTNNSSEEIKDGTLDVYRDPGTGNEYLVGTYSIGYLPPCNQQADPGCFGPPYADTPYVEINLPVEGFGATRVVFRGTLGLEENDAVVASDYGFCCPM
jgi:hypothetical protein